MRVLSAGLEDLYGDAEPMGTDKDCNRITPQSCRS
jgi:hypothetical protein